VTVAPVAEQEVEEQRRGVHRGGSGQDGGQGDGQYGTEATHVDLGQGIFFQWVSLQRMTFMHILNPNLAADGRIIFYPRRIILANSAH